MESPTSPPSCVECSLGQHWQHTGSAWNPPHSAPCATCSFIVYDQGLGSHHRPVERWVVLWECSLLNLVHASHSPCCRKIHVTLLRSEEQEEQPPAVLCPAVIAGYGSAGPCFCVCRSLPGVASGNSRAQHQGLPHTMCPATLRVDVVLQ